MCLNLSSYSEFPRHPSNSKIRALFGSSMSSGSGKKEVFFYRKRENLEKVKGLEEKAFITSWLGDSNQGNSSSNSYIHHILF